MAVNGLIGTNKTVAFVMSGQSNMVGHSGCHNIPQKYFDADVPLYTIGGKRPLIYGECFGPEVSFAHKMSEVMDDFIIIKYAENGSSLYAWSPRWNSRDAAITKNVDYGPLYSRLVGLCNDVVSRTGAVIGGIMWMQGERDARFELAANSYDANFAALIRALRSDLGDVPFAYGRVNPPASFKHREAVRTAQENMNLPDVRMINTDDCPKKQDGLHFNAIGSIILGRKFARAMFEMIGHDIYTE
jgi:hypothetical protein